MSESLATSIRMEPVGDVFASDSLNPQGLGFMCGLEIHQQLATGKLHSRMPSQLYDQGLEEIPREWTRSHRKLRASQGEGGRVDIAARFEARRNRSFVYVQPPNAGLIEIDEAPPLEHDKDAVNAVLTMSAMMDAKPVSSLQVMRKTVVDGSNTSGFQRTTLVATNGVISTNSGIVGIDVICLEEDSTNSGEIVYYILDRLGMPLVEIATAPDVQTPDHAKEVAIALGTMLRDTRMVRRGLGSIRQDLNVSIACGDRVEIKGCQDLDWIPKIIRLEMARQLHFYRLANTLRLEAGLPVLSPDRRQDSTPVENRVSASAKSRLPITIQNMTSEFETCDSAMVKKSLESGAVVKGISLPGFANKLGTKEVDKNGAQMPRLGREFASAAKLAGVAGIFHSDELPAYGISSIEVERVREALNLSEMDAFILCVAPDWQADLALESVVNRARMAYHRIPQEVRNVVIQKGSPEDGTTTAMRPLPGGARMYPETDVPVLRIEGDYWNTISENLPMNRSERATRLEKFKISSNQIEALLGAELDDIFVIGVEGGLYDCPSLPAKAWASILLDNTRSDIAKAVNIVEKAVDWPILTLTVHAREEGIITREGLIPMAALLITEGPTLGEAEFETRLSWFANRAEKEGFTPADTSAVEDAVDAILAERADFVAERGMEAVGPLMGMVMGKLGGAADGKIVSQVLREKIQKLT